MTRQVLSHQDYRGFRLTEVLRTFQTDQQDTNRVEWEITKVGDGPVTLIGKAPTEPVAKSTVDAIIQANQT